MDSLLFLIKKHNNNKTAGIVILALANTTNKVSFQQTTTETAKEERWGYSTQFKVVVCNVKHHRPLGIYQGLLRFINSQSISWRIKDALAPQASALSSAAVCLSSWVRHSLKVVFMFVHD